ncbi:serine/threonine-protein kinase pim-1-like [Aplochiton taeniatus]
MITRSSQDIPSAAPSHNDKGCGGLGMVEGRKRKRSATSVKWNVPKKPKILKKPNVLCQHLDVGQIFCDAASKSWLKVKKGPPEGEPQGPSLNQGERPGTKAVAGKCQEQHSLPSTSRPKATKRTRKARLENVYMKGPLLGKGGYGSVYAGTRKSDGMLVALKYVSKGQAEEELDIPKQGGPLPLEVALMKQVNSTPQSPHILQMLEWFDQPSRYVMVLERPEPCQDLTAFCHDHGGALSEELAQQLMMQLLRALCHCSQRGVLHRDVKPENLLIQTDALLVKLFDFGCGDLLKNTPYKDFAGTLEYTPPEWFLQRQYLAGAATVWSVGVTLYNLVCGFQPFSTIRETIKGRVRFTKGISPECRHLIRWCLSTKAADRPTLEQILLHPWLA